MRAIVIDDEKNSRQLMSTLLNEYCSQIQEVHLADSVENAIQLINTVNPHLIFLDIELQNENGFDLLDRLHGSSFLTCFATGYEKYALKAIKYGAFAYLLKPIDLEELKNTVDKVERHFKNTQLPDRINSIWVNDSSNLWKINVNEIIAVSSSGNYSEIATLNNTILTIEKLKYFEDLLPKNAFFRTHRSHIVNIEHIVKIQEGRTGKVLLERQIELPVANRRLKDFLEVISNFNS